MHPLIVEMGRAGQSMSSETSDLKAQRSIRQGLVAVNAAAAAHDKGDTSTASNHLGKAATFLQDAAQMHTGKLKRGDDNVSPVMLGHAHLGEGHQLHQDYIDEINKGKNNGR